MITAESVVSALRAATDAREEGEEGKDNMTTTREILSEVLSERVCQDGKWGVQTNTWPEWFSILMEEVGEAAICANHYHFPGHFQGESETVANMRRELIQSAAVIVAMVEQLDNGKAEVTR